MTQPLLLAAPTAAKAPEADPATAAGAHSAGADERESPGGAGFAATPGQSLTSQWAGAKLAAHALWAEDTKAADDAARAAQAAKEAAARARDRSTRTLRSCDGDPWLPVVAAALPVGPGIDPSLRLAVTVAQHSLRHAGGAEGGTADDRGESEPDSAKPTVTASGHPQTKRPDLDTHTALASGPAAVRMAFAPALELFFRRTPVKRTLAVVNAAHAMLQAFLGSEHIADSEWDSGAATAGDSDTRHRAGYGHTVTGAATTSQSGWHGHEGKAADDPGAMPRRLKSAGTTSRHAQRLLQAPRDDARRMFEALSKTAGLAALDAPVTLAVHAPRLAAAVGPLLGAGDAASAIHRPRGNPRGMAYQRRNPDSSSDGPHASYGDAHSGAGSDLGALLAGVPDDVLDDPESDGYAFAALAMASPPVRVRQPEEPISPGGHHDSLAGAASAVDKGETRAEAESFSPVPAPVCTITTLVCEALADIDPRGFAFGAAHGHSDRARVEGEGPTEVLVRRWAASALLLAMGVLRLES